MLFIKLLKKCSHRVWFRIGLSSKLWKRYIHTGSVSLMCRTVQQAPETVYTHGVRVHVRLSSKHRKLCMHTGSVSMSDCPASTGKCVYARGQCPCQTVQKAQETVYVHHVWVQIGLSIKHRKLSDCPAGTGKCVCTPCLGSYRTVHQALVTVYTHGVSVPVRLSIKHCTLYVLNVWVHISLSIKPRRLLAHRIWHTVLNQERNARSPIRANQRPPSTAPGVTMKDRRTGEGSTMNLMK